MNNFQLAAKALGAALKYKTLYVMGCFGAPLTPANKQRYIAHNAYNRKAARKKMIEAASADTFGFDCVCLIKGLLWGWDGDKNALYGGAKYCAGGVPDVGADAMIGLCKNVSTDFGTIKIGEAVWMKGHIGIYVGNGLCVECSPKWGNGVQITAVENVKKNKAYHGRKWTKHGLLPWVTYCPMGDLDFDGKVTAADAREALRAAVRETSLSDAQKLAADLTGDGEVTAADARRILRESVGLEDGA